METGQGIARINSEISAITAVNVQVQSYVLIETEVGNILKRYFGSLVSTYNQHLVSPALPSEFYDYNELPPLVYRLAINLGHYMNCCITLNSVGVSVCELGGRFAIGPDGLTHIIYDYYGLGQQDAEIQFLTVLDYVKEAQGRVEHSIRSINEVLLFYDNYAGSTDIKHTQAGRIVRENYYTFKTAFEVARRSELQDIVLPCNSHYT